MSRLDLDIRLVRTGFDLDLKASVPLQGVTAVFGPSGSGKTTLLRCIAGFEPDVQGRMGTGDTIWLDSAAHRRVPPHRRQVGTVFQDSRLFSHLTVAGNLAYGEIRVARDARIARGPFRDEVLDALDLYPLLKRSVDGLSGGERQRVAIGRTVLSRPRLLLFDEPLAGLDAQRREASLALIKTVTRRFAVPSLYVSHSVAEVARLADRILVLSQGRLVDQGATAEVLNRLEPSALGPSDEAGAVVEVQVREHLEADHLTRLHLFGQPLTIPLITAAPGETVRLLIRARDVALATHAPEGISIRNVLQGRLIGLDMAGPGAFAEAEVSVGEARLRARITREAARALGLAVGQDLFALVKSATLEG